MAWANDDITLVCGIKDGEARAKHCSRRIHSALVRVRVHLLAVVVSIQQQFDTTTLSGTFPSRLTSLCIIYALANDFFFFFFFGVYDPSMLVFILHEFLCILIYIIYIN